MTRGFTFLAPFILSSVEAFLTYNSIQSSSRHFHRRVSSATQTYLAPNGLGAMAEHRYIDGNIAAIIIANCFVHPSCAGL